MNALPNPVLATSTTVQMHLVMCDDCAQIIANGVDSNDADQRAHLLVMADVTASWRGTIVVDHHTTDFSTRYCTTCDTTLAGSRWSGVLLG